MDSAVNINYCGKKCSIGKEKSNIFLNKNNSAYDAAMDFVWFTEECFRTCPFKDKHTKQDKKL
jgi:hypothetical protein